MMPFFKSQFHALAAQERLDQALAVLASDGDGARLLALAKKNNIEFCIVEKTEGGSYGGLDQPLKVSNHDDLASYVMTLVHELRHLEQDTTWGLFAQRYRLKPTEQALLTRIVEADAFSFSAAFVHRQLKSGTLRGAFADNRMYMQTNPLTRAFSMVAQKRTLKTTQQLDVYHQTVRHFSQGLMGSYYDLRSFQLCNHILASPDTYQPKLPPNTTLGTQGIEDVYDIDAGLPLPGGAGEITLGTMLENAAASIKPIVYTLFAKLDKQLAAEQDTHPSENAPRTAPRQSPAGRF